MSERLTDAQMTVLRALEKLPEGEWITAKEGGFNGKSAGLLAAHVFWAPPELRYVWKRRYDRSSYRLTYRLTPAGRALIAKLKAEGKWQ